MRLLFDTNVLFAAHISNGLCARLYERALAGETLVSSGALLAELEEKLISKAKLPASEAAQVRAEVEAEMELVIPAPLPNRVCREERKPSVSERAELALRSEHRVQSPQSVAAKCAIELTFSSQPWNNSGRCPGRPAV